MSTPPSSVPASAEARQAKLSPVARIFGVLFSPGETFVDIARVPSWLAPLLVLTVFSLAVNAVLAQRVDWYQETKKQIEKSSFASSRMEQLKPEQREEAYQTGARRAKSGRYVRGAIGPLLVILIAGGAYFGAFKLAGASALNYKTACSIYAFAFLPIAVHDLIGIPIVLLKDSDAINPENFVASNLAAFLSGDAPAWQQVLASSVDLFAVWRIVLLAIGFSAFNPKKISFGKALGVVIAVYLFFTLFGTGIAYIFS